MTPKIRFEPIGMGHMALLRDWLDKPHWSNWWGDRDTELRYIHDMIEGRDTTRPFIFHVGNGPLGYIQFWFIGHHQNETWIKDNPWLNELPSNAVGVDLSIGVEDKLSKGIGSAVPGAFIAKLLDEGQSTIIIDPDSANVRAVRAYAKSGFRPVPRLLGKTGDSMIMQYDLNENEQDT